MANSKNRTQLQNLFKSGAKPSEADFKDLIEGGLNIADDGIEKPKGADTPLKISTHGDQENALDIYGGEVHTWRINQKPINGSRGLNLETGADQSSKLFIESSTGNVGLGVTKPIAKLHIQQSGSQNALRIDDEASDTTPLIIDAEGKVGIGTDQPSKKLDVRGNTAITGNSLSLKGDAPVLTICGQRDDDNATIQLRETQAENYGFDLKYIGNADNKFYVESYQNGVSKGKHLTIDRDSGNVGIGTPDSEGNKLKVNGNTAIAGTLSVTQTSTLTGNVGIGITPSTEKLKVNGNTAIIGILSATTIIGDGAIITGMILMWSGAINQIPDGWAICNGSNGTPNLANRFILGSTTDTGSKTGGNSTHSHTTGKGDNRTRNAIVDVAAAGKKRDDYSDEIHTHTVSSANHLPPYYKLIFLMKL